MLIQIQIGIQPQHTPNLAVQIGYHASSHDLPILEVLLRARVVTGFVSFAPTQA